MSMVTTINYSLLVGLETVKAEKNSRTAPNAVFFLTGLTFPEAGFTSG